MRDGLPSILLTCGILSSALYFAGVISARRYLPSPS